MRDMGATVAIGLRDCQGCRKRAVIAFRDTCSVCKEGGGGGGCGKQGGAVRVLL